MSSGTKLYRKPEQKYKDGKVLDLKGYGKVKIIGAAWLTPPMTSRPQYIYDFVSNPNKKITKYTRNDFSLYEYEVDMMLADYETGIDYEKSYKKYIDSGLIATGNPPLSYTSFIEVMNRSLYAKKHPEFDTSIGGGFAKTSRFSEVYGVEKFAGGGKIIRKKMHPKDLTKLPYFEEAQRGAEFYSLQEENENFKEKIEKANRWYELMILNQKVRKLTPDEFKEFELLSMELRQEKMKNGGSIPEMNKLYKDHHDVWEKAQEIEKNVCEHTCTKYSKVISDMWENDLKQHFNEEEKVLFPEIKNELNASVIDELISEHREMETLIGKIKSENKTTDIKKFCKTIINHIKKEEILMNEVVPDPYKEVEVKFDDGGEAKKRVFRSTQEDVKERSNQIVNKIILLQKQMKWHNDKKVKYPLNFIELDTIKNNIPNLKKEISKLNRIYLDMRKKKQKTVSDNILKASGFNIRAFNSAIRILESKYILNYTELNKTQTVDGKFYSPSELRFEEEAMKRYMVELAKALKDHDNLINLKKKQVDENAIEYKVPYVLLQNNDDEFDVIVFDYKYYKENKSEYADYKVVYQNNAGVDVEGIERLEKIREEAERKRKEQSKLNSVELQAVKDVITLNKYSRLTDEEAAYLYGAFKDYEVLIDEYGEYVTGVDTENDSDLSEILDSLEQKQYLYHFSGTVEAYNLAIDFVNSVRARIESLQMTQAGGDLFADENGSPKVPSRYDVEEALNSLKTLQETDPDNKEVSDAIESMQSLLDTAFKDGGSIKYYVVEKEGRPVLKAKFGRPQEDKLNVIKDMLDKLADRGYKLNQITEGDYKKFDYSKVNPEDVSEFTKGCDYYENGGKIVFNKYKVPSTRIYNYALKIKKEYPQIWKLGGNVFGNQAFKNLEKVIKRGYWLDSEKWMFIKWQSYVARHHKDYRIEGVIAMLKWIDTVDKGWAYMKELIEDKIKGKRFDEGGSVGYERAIEIFKSEEGRSPEPDNKKDIQLIFWLQKALDNASLVNKDEIKNYDESRFYYWELGKKLFEMEYGRTPNTNNMSDLTAVSAFQVGLSESQKESNLVTVDVRTSHGLEYDFDVDKSLSVDDVIKLAKDKSAPNDIKWVTYKGTKYTLDKKDA